MGRLATVARSLALTAVLLVAFTPVGVADYWDSAPARAVDATLNAAGDRVAALLERGVTAPSPAAGGGAPTAQGPAGTTGPPPDDPELSHGRLTARGMVHVAPGDGRLNESAIERLVHRFVVERRGGGSMRYDAGLARVARYHSDDMARAGAIFHTAPDGETLRDRLSRFGADCRVAGENVAYTYAFVPVRTADGARTYDSEREVARGLVAQWMNSSSHRENLLRPSFDREGVGVWVAEADGEYRLYATQVLCGG